jgi:hypothetical protein
VTRLPTIHIRDAPDAPGRATYYLDRAEWVDPMHLALVRGHLGGITLTADDSHAGLRAAIEAALQTLLASGYIALTPDGRWCVSEAPPGGTR